MCKFTHNSHSDSHIPMHVSAYKRKHNSDFNKPSICFNFKNFGSWKYGRRCKYAHIADGNVSNIVKSQQENFLGELWGLLGSVREVVDTHRHLPYQVPMVCQQPPQFSTTAGQGQMYATVLARSAISGLKGKPLEAMKPRGGKRIRHGGKSKRKKETSREHTKSCVLFYTNINGFKSKADSLKQLIIEHNVDVLVLTKTKVYSKSKIRLDGYQVFPAVRKRNGGGGMLVAVKHGHCSSVMIDEGEIC